MNVIDFYQRSEVNLMGEAVLYTNFRDGKLMLRKTIYGYYAGTIHINNQLRPLPIGVPTELEAAKRLTIANAIHTLKKR